MQLKKSLKYLNISRNKLLISFFYYDGKQSKKRNIFTMPLILAFIYAITFIVSLAAEINQFMISGESVYLILTP